jgi:hypothetical protein
MAGPPLGQRELSGVAHWPQKFIPSRFSNPQLGQRIPKISRTEPRPALSQQSQEAKEAFLSAPLNSTSPLFTFSLLLQNTKECGTYGEVKAPFDKCRWCFILNPKYEVFSTRQKEES